MGQSQEEEYKTYILVEASKQSKNFIQFTIWLELALCRVRYTNNKINTLVRTWIVLIKPMKLVLSVPLALTVTMGKWECVYKAGSILSK